MPHVRIIVFDNLGGFRTLFGIQPNTRLAVLTFGLWWRSKASFARYALIANSLIITAGFMLTGYQLTGFLIR
jgi:hypothetical protein